MQSPSSLLICMLLLVVCVCQTNAHQDKDDDVNDALFREVDIEPVSMFKERRGLDFCQTNPNPCKNSGTCCSSGWCVEGGLKYTCRCRSPYAGKHCEHKCPLRECWDSFYKQIYSNGRKRAIESQACKGHVETLHSCLKSSLESKDVCKCDDTSLMEAMSFDKERKDYILQKQCSSSTGGCVNKAVEECTRKIYAVEGAIDSSKPRTETEKCSLVDDAISCMNALSGSDFSGCVHNRKVFTENVAIRHAQWRTWCMGKFCSLYNCGKVTIPNGCSGDSIRGRTAPVFECMKNKIKTCIPSKAGQLGQELQEVQHELEGSVAAKCRLHKQVREQCQGKEDKRSLEAQDLLRLLLQRTLQDE